MALYLSVVKGAEQQGPIPHALEDAMGALIQEWLAKGVLVQTGGLVPSAAGARVRVEDGKLTVTDGPYSEAKEVVGGYAILKADSREAAIEATRAFMDLHRKHWPAWVGECELREIAFLAP
jgi:hypothetical protein